MNAADTIKDIVIDEINRMKGEDLVVLDVAELTPLMERMIIATAGAERHLDAIGAAVTKRIKDEGIPFHLEGEPSTGWLLIDIASVVVHLFLEDSRRRYDLESLWADAPGARR